ncbi:MmyB family transcriptional regulator [Nocardia fluminea]|uniref:MmyB family transcriptional regulator n=1 Tax=Nocardia fluminea TaxID=134984 RepID=UPI0033C911A7
MDGSAFSRLAGRCLDSAAPARPAQRAVVLPRQGAFLAASNLRVPGPWRATVAIVQGVGKARTGVSAVTQLTRSRDSELLTLPTFGHFLRWLRDDRRMSRERLAMSAGVSASYVTHLEWGDRDHPARAVVEALIDCLGRTRALTVTERRHLFDLAGLPITSTPTVAQLRARISDDALRILDAHRGGVAGYFDARGNILALNSAAQSMLPGLNVGGNGLHWLFGNEIARQVVVDWDSVAHATVSGLRGRIGTFGHADWPEQLLDELGVYPEFRSIWNAGEVTFSSELPMIRLRESMTARPACLTVQVFDVDVVDYPGWLRAFMGTRRDLPVATAPII